MSENDKKQKKWEYARFHDDHELCRFLTEMGLEPHQVLIAIDSGARPSDTRYLYYVSER